MSVVEYGNDFNHVLSDHQVNDILGQDADGSPRLNLFPERDPKHKALINLLAPGLAVDKPQVRKDIAEILARYPQQCLGISALALAVEPIGDVDICVPGETDNRRVTQLLFTGCLAIDLRDCEYDLSYDGGCNFEIGGLKTFLTACNRSLDAAIDNGAVWDAKVYQRSQAFSNLKSLQRVRDYFARKSLRSVAPPASVPEQTRERCGPKQALPYATDCEVRERDAYRAAESHAREIARHSARDQIAHARHEAEALFISGNAEAAYYAGCLGVAHTGRPPDAIGVIPRDTDSVLRYDCAYYSENDYRVTYLNSDWHILDHGQFSFDGKHQAEKRVIEAFTLASKSSDSKLAARAYWNLAVLALMHNRDGGGAEKARKALAEARRLDPGAFAP
ncbi:hypothetical protein [Blastomonas sp.]|uniref:hypothetical protein n=1 Tax=Blastomonas sp. TaxID=1909299 RepID=UPI0035947690